MIMRYTNLLFTYLLAYRSAVKGLVTSGTTDVILALHGVLYSALASQLCVTCTAV